MKGEMQLYYDKEGDFLEINIGPYTKGYFRNLGKGLFERVDEKTEKVTGIAVLSFMKRTDKSKDIKIQLPTQFKITA